MSRRSPLDGPLSLQLNLAVHFKTIYSQSNKFVMGVKSKKLGLWVNQNFTDSSAHLFLSQNKKKIIVRLTFSTQGTPYFIKLQAHTLKVIMIKVTISGLTK